MSFFGLIKICNLSYVMEASSVKFVRVECLQYHAGHKIDTKSCFNPSFSVKLLAQSWGRGSVVRKGDGGCFDIKDLFGLGCTIPAASQVGFLAISLIFTALGQCADLWTCLPELSIVPDRSSITVFLTILLWYLKTGNYCS